MAYKHRFGITNIKKSKFSNLSISWDFDNDEKDVGQRMPILFFTPDMSNKNEHHHISLNHKQAKALCKWLGDYLEDKNRGNK